MSEQKNQKKSSTTKWILVLVLILLLVSPLCFFLIRYSSLNREITRLRGEHEPTKIAHMQPKRIAGSGNAAYYINDAGFEEDFAAYCKQIFEPLEQKRGEGELRPDADSAAALEQIENEQPSIIRSIYAACSKCDGWRPDVDLSAIGASEWIERSTELSGQIRAIVRLLVWKMKVSSFNQDPDGAVSVGVRALNLIDHAAEFPAGLSGHLNNVASRSVVLAEIERVLTEQDVKNDTLVSAQAMLRRHEGPNHYISALRSERAIGLDMLRQQSAFQYNLSGAAYLNLMKEEIAAAREGRATAEVSVTPIDVLVEQAKPALARVRQAEEQSQAMIKRVVELVNEKMKN